MRLSNGYLAMTYLFAVATTKWHLLGVEVFAQKLQQQYGSLTGAVLLRHHPVSGDLLSKKDLPWAEETEISIVKYSERRSFLENLRLLITLPVLAILPLRNRIWPVRSPVHIAAPIQTPWSAVIDTIGLWMLVVRGARVYRIDEGFSSYIPDAFWSSKRSRENYDSIDSRLLLLLRSKLDDLQKWLFKHLDTVLLTEDRCLFEIDKEEETMIPRETIVTNYAQAVRNLDESLKSTTAIRRIDSIPIALVITQPWSEGGELEADKEARLLERLLKFLFSRGFCLRLKIHPRETPHKYNLIVEKMGSKDLAIVDGNMLAESLFTELGPDDAVVGFFSTALLNAKMFYQRSVFTVPDAWMSTVDAPTELIETQRLFLRYTRLLIKDVSYIPQANKSDVI